MSAPDDPDPPSPTPEGVGESLREHVFGEVEQRLVKARLAASLLGGTFEPVRIGKFVVHGRIGAGAMSVVFAGYDETLGRRVAIKLLHARRGDGPDLHVRMLREAQALARLDHPNVVRVYDAGEHEDRLFIAMELVDGTTLRKWTRDNEPPWTRTLAAYRQAGAGLAAAHEAGLMHRDFKPDNVMFGDDGRVRVMDFGLARGLEEPPSEPAPGSDADTSASADDDPLGAPLTHSGVLVGTPAYMAPEQLEGRPADSRADQFSFCVALWESLVGSRPYAGSTLRELAQSFERGRPEPTMMSGSMPAWIRRILERGLAVDPAARWPSMTVLLEQLARDPVRRRRRLGLLGLGGASVISLVTWQHTEAQRRIDRCAAAAAEIDETWNPAAADALTARLSSANPTLGPSASVRVIDYLDPYAQTWRETREAVCRESVIDGTRSASRLAAAEACLDDRRDALAGLLRGLDEPTPDALSNATLVAAGLADIESCTDDAWLAHRAPEPEDEATRDEVARLRRKLAEVTALHRLARYDEARSTVEALRAPAAATEYPPIEAEVLLRAGSLAQVGSDSAGAEKDLERALLIAGRSGHDAVTMDAFTLLTWVVGYHQHRHDEGLRLGRLSEMMLDRFGQGQRPRAATLLAYIGSIAEEKGDLDAALDYLERAKTIAESALGPEHPRVAAALHDLGSLYDTRGEFELALEYLGRARTLRDRALGPEHPHVAQTLRALAMVNAELRRFDEAEALYRRAIAMFAASLGPEHPHVATARFNFARLQQSRGRFDEAVKLHRETLQWRIANLDPDHPQIASSHAELGQALMSKREFEDALEQFRESLRINEKVYGDKHPDVAIAWGYIGTTLRRLGRHDEAIEALGRALAIQEEALGSDHVNVAVTLAFLGEAYGEQGRWDDALAMYRRSVEIRESKLGDAHAYTWDGRLLVAIALGETRAWEESIPLLERVIEAASEIEGMELGSPARFELGRALWLSGRDRERGRELVQESLAAFEAQGPAGDKGRSEVARWIADHLDTED
jgi:serine/threonine-protein kinase